METAHGRMAYRQGKEQAGNRYEVLLLTAILFRILHNALRAIIAHPPHLCQVLVKSKNL